MSLPELRPRQPLAGIALAAVAGIAVADRWGFNWSIALILLTLGVAGILWRPSAVACWFLAAASFGTLHTVRHHHGDGRRLSEQLSTGPRPALVTGVVSNEPEEAKTWGKTPVSRFQLQLENIEIGGRLYPYQTTVNVRWSGEMPVYGDRVQLRGTADNIARPRNPGQFDFRAYSQRQGTYCEVNARYASDCKILEHGCGNPAYSLAFAARHWMRDQLALDLTDDPTVVDVIASMVLGLKGETPDDIQDLFRITGTMHLFAVSGLNIAMLAAITWFLLKPLRVSRRASVFIAIPIIVTYAMITGLGASCVRATIMGSLLLAGFLFDRPPSLFNSLAAAALIIFAWDTNQLFMPGFQFSFALVLALAWLSAPVQRRIEPFGQPDEFLPQALWSWRQRGFAWSWNVFASALGVTIASWLGSFAITVHYFHMISPASIVANLVAVPLAFAILVLGLFAVLSAPLSAGVAALFNNANWVCAKLLLLSVQLFAGVPGGHQYIETPDTRSRPAAELTVFDLGQGGAIHLRSGKEDWLIDCGHRFEYERIVLPYLHSRGVNRLDGLVLTHGDAQHIGAAQDVWKELQPAALFDSALKDRSQTRRVLYAALAQQQRGKRILRRGDIAETAGDVRLEVLYPPAGLTRSQADDKALVLRFTAAGCRVLLMSDSGFATERWLIDNEPDLHADILVKGWHSKDLSGTADFLTRVNPQAIIAASAPPGNMSAELEQWSAQAPARNAMVFRQEHTGAVQVELLRDGTFELKGFLNRLIFRGRATH